MTAQARPRTPRGADPALGTALISAAAQIVAEEGRGALSLRRLASEVGTSTMAIYTNFGNMDGLMRAVRSEGFSRLRNALDAVDETDDPLADLALLGTAYYSTAVSEPNLYRSMFLEAPVDEADYETGLDTFIHLCNAVERCCNAGTFPNADPTDPAEMALEIWAINHGFVTLRIAHIVRSEQVTARLASTFRSLFLAWGADPSDLEASFQRAKHRQGNSDLAPQW